MSTFWSIWVIVLTLGVIFGCTGLLFYTRKFQAHQEETEETMGHSFDGIEELDNPLPLWWFYLFLITVVFGLIYLILYPGLGNFKGLKNWTSTGQWEAEMAKAEQKFAPIFERYAQLSIEELKQEENAEGLRIGQRLFANNCAVCHGTGGAGAKGFPNLADNDWLYGDTESAIKTSILQGRNGNMPNFANLGEQGIDDMTHYVLSLSALTHDTEKAARAEPVFAANCVACHMPDGTGFQALGAPNLTDDIWLYGGGVNDIKLTLRNGRMGVMPAFSNQLTEDQIHLLTGYIMSLSQ